MRSARMQRVTKKVCGEGRRTGGAGVTASKGEKRAPRGMLHSSASVFSLGNCRFGRRAGRVAGREMRGWAVYRRYRGWTEGEGAGSEALLLLDPSLTTSLLNRT